MRPAQNGVRVREDVTRLAPWDPTLLWYARAVRRMRERPLADPRSWRFQAAIHAVSTRTVSQSDTLPSSGVVSTYWHKCQHGSWYFLPWHRAYLGCFEAIVRATIAELGGPHEDWALPYWDYSRAGDPQALRLRREFLVGTLEDGSNAPNALAEARRTPDLDLATGEFGMDAADVDLTCLKTAVFSVPAASRTPSFGGGRTFSHSGRSAGDVEITPHGDVHTAVGGPGGLMSAFDTAGLDPVFWLHHANIDRLWEVWRRRSPQHQDPTQTDWLQTVRFDFHDGAGAAAQFASGEVLDTTSPRLGYIYEDISDPVGGAALAEVPLPDPDRPATLIGSADDGARLGAARVAAEVVIDARALSSSAALAETGSRYVLELENITGVSGGQAFDIHVSPSGAEAGPEAHVGRLATFGVPEATDPAGLEGGSGLTWTKDITELVEGLQARGVDLDGGVTVSFTPRRGGEVGQVHIGRVSLYRA